ncbi:MAG: hypothetical protein IT383_06085 [Deltaproteobacteria bacterium]|nr:hypothetical protein [Deltaproteobacteria bacterium]
MKTLTLLVALAAAVAPAQARAAASLDEAFATELATLEAERAALEQARDAAHARRAERTAALRRDIARLDAALVSAAAQKDSLRSAVAALEASASPSEGARVDRARLDERLQRLERDARVQRVESGFFDRDGAYVTGTVLLLGNAAAVGVSDKSAGPLAQVAEGGRQVAVAPGPMAEAARSALTQGGQIPLFFGRAPQDDPRVDASSVDVLTRGGAVGLAVIVAAFLTLALALARALWLLRAWLRARRLLTDVAARLRARDALAAFGRCRQERGPAADLYGAVVGDLTTDPASAEERAGAQLLAAHERIDLGRTLTYAGIAATLVGAALAGVLALEQTLVAFAGASTQPVPVVMDAVAAALSPATIALGAALPAVLLALIAAALSAKLRVELEGGVLAILDAVRTTEREAVAARAGVTFLPPLGRGHEASA